MNLGSPNNFNRQKMNVLTESTKIGQMRTQNASAYLSPIGINKNDQNNQSKLMDMINESKQRINNLHCNNNNIQYEQNVTPKIIMSDYNRIQQNQQNIFNSINQDEVEKQITHLFKRVQNLEKQLEQKDQEERMLEIQQELLQLKDQQIESNNMIYDNQKQGEQFQQLLVVQDRMKLLEEKCQDQFNKYETKQLRIESSINSLAQKVNQILLQQNDNEQIFTSKLQEVHQINQVLQQLQQDIQKDNDYIKQDIQENNKKLQSFRSDVNQEIQNMKNKLQSIDKIEYLEQDFMKIMAINRELQQQVQQCNRGYMNLKDQMLGEMNKVQREILDKTLQYKQKIYQRIRNIEELEEEI